MLRGYRSIILAIAGLALLTGAQQHDKEARASNSAAQSETTAPQTTPPTPAPQTTYRPYAGYNPDPCYQAKDHDAADLCAQWRAALGAEKAAHETRRATTWGIAATALSFATLAGLIITILQTQGALSEARRGNILAMRENARSTRRTAAAARDQQRALNIAESQLLLSEKSTKAQIRSYLAVDRIEPFQTSGVLFSVKVFIKNVGQTPARIKSASAIAWISQAQTISPIKDGPEPIKYYHFVDVLAQGAEDRILAICEDTSIADKINDTDKADIYVYGRIEFTDVFGDDHWMTFASCPAGWGFTEDTKFRPCIHGNDGD